MTILEPATTITDYILAAAGIFFAVRCLAYRPVQPSTRLWILGFFMGSAAAITGGTFHGFKLYMEDSTERALWNATTVLIGAGAAFMVSAALSGPLKRGAPATNWFQAGLALSVGGLVIQQGKLGLSSGFNHNDVYHVIQTAALYCFYAGARILAMVRESGSAAEASRRSR